MFNVKKREKIPFTCIPQELLDPSKGFVKDDSIELQAYVVADAPEESPEGVVEFAINNVSKLGSSILSNAAYIRGLPWYVSVHVLYHPSINYYVCVTYLMLSCFGGLCFLKV